MKPLWITAYSASHYPLFQKHFKPSFDTFFAPRFDLKVRKIKGNPGKFGEKAFNEMGVKAMTEVLEIIKQHIGRFVIVTGCDFRFYEDFYGELKQEVFCKDLVGIFDVYGPLCGDFMAYKVTPKIIALYEWMIKYDRMFPNQQFTFNAGIRSQGIHAGQLSHDFWTVGMELPKSTIWNPGTAVNPPPAIKLHHGNFAVGADNKLALLDLVMKKVYENTPKM